MQVEGFDSASAAAGRGRRHIGTGGPRAQDVNDLHSAEIQPAELVEAARVHIFFLPVFRLSRVVLTPSRC